MKLILLSLALACSFGLPACSSMSKKKPVEAPKAAPYIWQKSLLKRGDLERVRTGEFVKTYHVGRSVSGRRGNVLHEAHRAYRLEKPSRWNLARDQPPLESTGPVNRVVDSAFKPAPQSQAIRAELNRQREISTELERTSDVFTETVIAAKAQLNQSKLRSAALADLQKEIVRLREENTALQKAAPVPAESEPESPAEALRKWGKDLDQSSTPVEAK